MLLCISIVCCLYELFDIAHLSCTLKTKESLGYGKCDEIRDEINHVRKNLIYFQSMVEFSSIKIGPKFTKLFKEYEFAGLRT